MDCHGHEWATIRDQRASIPDDKVLIVNTAGASSANAVTHGPLRRGGRG
jgi:hypothetical protein